MATKKSKRSASSKKSTKPASAKQTQAEETKVSEAEAKANDADVVEEVVHEVEEQDLEPELVADGAGQAVAALVAPVEGADEGVELVGVVEEAGGVALLEVLVEDLEDRVLDGLEVVDDRDALLVEVLGGVVVLVLALELQPESVHDVVLAALGEGDDPEDPVVLRSVLGKPEADLVPGLQSQ